MKNTSARIDDLGRAYAGSQLQIQIYVNLRAEELSQKIIQGLPSLDSLGPRLCWASPLEKDKFAEYQDSAFLKACGFEHRSSDLRKFRTPYLQETQVTPSAPVEPVYPPSL